MFGKGIYFADIVSKSANYCFANRINPIGCLLLCEVALGEPCEKYYADYYGNLLPPGKHSVKGVGKESPEEGEYFNHVYVPNGKPAPTGITNVHFG